jgi:hypothetical protein
MFKDKIESFVLNENVSLKQNELCDKNTWTALHNNKLKNGIWNAYKLRICPTKNRNFLKIKMIL